MDYFEVFDLPRRLTLDTAALQTRFYELSRRWHPDYQQSASATEQARALERSALVNAAYRVLRDPIARAEYLVRLEDGPGAPGTLKPAAPPELLAEIFEVQEMLQEARAAGLDAEGRRRVAEERDRLTARHAAEDARVSGALAVAWDAATPAERPALLAELRRALATRAYLRTVLDDLNAALEAAPDGDVAHHRH